MRSYIARQPIFDRSMQTVGYELLYRSSEVNSFPDVTSEFASINLISEEFLSFSTAPKDKDTLLFINLPPHMVVENMLFAVPKDNVIIELLEDADPTMDLLTSVKELHSLGFKFALDDFNFHPDWIYFLPYISVLKFDVKLYEFTEVMSFLNEQRVKLENVQLLAEKVECREVFELYFNAGFELFQGYFYKQPEIYFKKRLATNSLNCLLLMSEACKDDIDLNKIEEIVRRDVALSVKLIKYCNNVIYSSLGYKNEKLTLADSIKCIGVERLKKFISLVNLTTIEDSVSQEINNTSAIRAKFCELLSQHYFPNNNSSDAFLCGLFSHLDTILEIPMNGIVAELPISEDIKIALNHNEGDLSVLLEIVTLCEKNDLNGVEEKAISLNIDSEIIFGFYNKSLVWLDELPKNPFN